MAEEPDRKRGDSDAEWIARLSAEECADRGNAGCPGDTNDL